MGSLKQAAEIKGLQAAVEALRDRVEALAGLLSRDGVGDLIERVAALEGKSETPGSGKKSPRGAGNGATGPGSK